MGSVQKATGPRANREIDSARVRLVGEDGVMFGVVELEQALQAAEEAGLDLVEISPNSDPPVCKVLDHGKFKYEEQKKKNLARKKQKLVDVKEIKMRPGIDTHDYLTKMRSMKKFLDEGDKVKVTVRFRGREMLHPDRGMNVLKRVQGDIEEVGKVEQFPRMEGRLMTMVVSSRV